MKQAKERIDSLTSMRFFAAAMIVSLHGLGRELGFAWTNKLALAQGVSFFFVLSGFVLTYNHPVLPDWKAVRAFYRDRFARIWPSHIAATIALIVLVPSAGYYSLPESLRIQITASYVFLIHAWIPDPPFVTAYNTVAWSISTEFFFYLCFPLLIASFARTWKWKLVALACVTVSTWVLSAKLSAISGMEITSDFVSYINPISRVLEFFLGIACANTYRKYSEQYANKRSFLRDSMLESAAVVLVLASLFLSKAISDRLSAVHGLSGVWSLIATTTGIGILLFPFFIITFAFSRGCITRVLSSRGLVFLGEISFALYLVHPIFLLYRQQAPSLFYALPREVVIGMYWGCGLVLATIVHFLVELPGMNLLRERSRRASLTKQSSLRLISFCAIIVASFYLQPSVRQSVTAFTPPSSARLFDGTADFSSGDRLEAVYLDVGQDSSRLLSMRFAWKSLSTHALNKVVAVHFVDAKGAMLNQKDFRMELGAKSIEKGSRWINIVPLKPAELAGVSKIAVALYDRHGLVSINAPSMPTDWNNSRLLIDATRVSPSR